MGFVWRVYFFAKLRKKSILSPKMVKFFGLSSYSVENECFACMSGGPPRCLPFPFPRQGCLPGLCSKPFAEVCPPPGFSARRLAPLQPPSSCAAGTPNSPPPTLLPMC